VCEEKPALMNVAETKRTAWSVIASEGSTDIAGTAVTLLGCPGVVMLVHAVTMFRLHHGPVTRSRFPRVRTCCRHDWRQQGRNQSQDRRDG
jgi:hypothetical protein